MRAEIDGNTIYLWHGGSLLGVAVGSLKRGWRARPAGGRLGRKIFTYAPEALADRLDIPRHEIASAIIKERANAIVADQ